MARVAARVEVVKVAEARVGAKVEANSEAGMLVVVGCTEGTRAACPAAVAVASAVHLGAMGAMAAVAGATEKAAALVASGEEARVEKKVAVHNHCSRGHTRTPNWSIRARRPDKRHFCGT
jgi:hypothetical protein